MIDISIASYSFHGLYEIGAMSVFQYLETIKYRYNCCNADIWNGMLTSYDGDYLRLVRQQMDERGLKLMNLCCDGCHIWADSAEQRARQERLALDCIRAAGILGARTVRIDVGVAEPVMSDEQLQYVAQVYARYCRLAAEFGAKLGPENHWGASNNALELRKLFELVKEDNFSLLLHVGNWANTPDAGESCTDPRRMQYNIEFAPRAMHMHAMFEVCAAAEQQLLPLIEAGYGGAVSIESHLATNEFNNVAYQLANVRRVLAPCDYANWPEAKRS